MMELLEDLVGMKVVIAPFNDISLELSHFLPDGVIFSGFIDKSKKGEKIFSPESLPEHDYVIVHSPNYWREISSNFSEKKVLLFNKAGRDLIAFSDYEGFINEDLYYDVLLLPLNKSNIQDLSLISRELKSINVSSAIIDSMSENNDNFKEGLGENLDIPVVLRDQVDKTEFSAVIASADWQEGFCRPFLKEQREKGKYTIGIVDGIEDFEDSDYDMDRDAYNTVEYVFLMGEDDQKYFNHKIEKTSIVGLPKMWSLYHSYLDTPKANKVMINVNFTYGYFEEARDSWVKNVIDVCEELKVPYIISQHHADNGYFIDEIVSKKNVYDTILDSTVVISRFSTVILESLALRRQVIYFNPHGETVKIYSEENGAYHIAKDNSQLKASLMKALSNKEYGRLEAKEFLNRKCNINSKTPPARLVASKVKRLLKENIF